VASFGRVSLPPVDGMCVGAHVACRFIYELTYEGFLCIACELTGNSTCPLFILIPKLHAQRCVVDLSEHKLHISKSIRKHSKKFWLSFDMAFDKVVEACVAQHGENWLYLPMRNALRILHNNIPANHTGPRALSVELWQGPEGNAAESTLVAGELGMAYGAVRPHAVGSTIARRRIRRTQLHVKRGIVRNTRTAIRVSSSCIGERAVTVPVLPPLMHTARLALKAEAKAETNTDATILCWPHQASSASWFATASLQRAISLALRHAESLRGRRRVADSLWRVGWAARRSTCH
jgi:hypothetical protein